jgi:hypothetical protein
MDTAWRATIDKHHAALSADLSAQFETKLESEIVRSHESLNQAIRRIRQAPAEAQTFQFVVEASAPWADNLVVVMAEYNQLPGAALNACVESKDPISLLASPAEIGEELATRIGEGSKVWLFPVVVRSKTVAILVAHGKVSPVAMELLSEVAGMRLESQRTPTLSVNEQPQAWEDLSADDQAQHRQAQRVARFRVAEMRLDRPARLEQAVFAGNIYSTFRDDIDRARDEFLKQHLTKSPTMVDYLHLEILRSLAHDDERLLGADYPGPMA